MLDIMTYTAISFIPRHPCPPCVCGLANDCSVHLYLCELLTIAVQTVLVESGFIIQSPTLLKAQATAYITSTHVFSPHCRTIMIAYWPLPFLQDNNYSEKSEIGIVKII